MAINLKHAFVIACLAVAGNASAAPQDKYFVEQGVELYQGLKTGMSKNEVDGLKIQKDFELVKDCRVRIRPIFRNNRLFSVVIVSKWTMSYNSCAELVQRSLNAKYGKSVGLSAKNDLPSRGIYIEERWLTGNLVIILDYQAERLFSISYEPRLIVEEARLIDGL